MGSGSGLGTIGVGVPVGPNQTAVATVGVAPNATTFTNGNVIINWDIFSGAGMFTAANAVVVGPTTLQNGGNVLDPVTAAFAATAGPATAQFVARGFETTYYSSPGLTQSNNAGTVSPIGAGGTVNQSVRTGGQEAAYFTATKLVQLQVFVVPGDVVRALRAKGVNVDDVNELSKYVKL